MKIHHRRRIGRWQEEEEEEEGGGEEEIAQYNTARGGEVSFYSSFFP